MKLYRTKNGIVLDKDDTYYLIEDESWDTLVNDENLFSKLKEITERTKISLAAKDFIRTGLLSPVGAQELWASGVTYLQSREGRKEESKKQGGGNFYERVYEAERPELFFKAMGYRTVGSGENVSIRKDSDWNVPEPELTVFATTSGKIVGYTIGNDMSSRSIEGENPLYLPQAKVYDGSAAVGPCIYVIEHPLPGETEIQMKIYRNNSDVFYGRVSLNKMRRSPEDLVSYLYRELSFPNGSFLMTGTGIVPPREFSLKTGDRIEISIDNIGTLVNNVK